MDENESNHIVVTTLDIKDLLKFDITHANSEFCTSGAKAS